MQAVCRNVDPTPSGVENIAGGTIWDRIVALSVLVRPRQEDEHLMFLLYPIRDAVGAHESRSALMLSHDPIGIH